MTEIPEHLRKRAAEARAKAESEAAPPAASADAPEADDAPQSEAASKIPAHLLERSKAAKKKADGGDDGAGGSAVEAAAPAAAAAASAGGVAVAAAPAMATGPGGHTQRLLTVVKSGSIQDVKAVPQDKVHTCLLYTSDAADE